MECEAIKVSDIKGEIECMIREIKKYKIKKIHPRFFWTKCNKCKKEFKKQDGYKITYKDGTIVTICSGCAGAETKLAELVEQGLKFGIKFPMTKIKPPGPPPNQYPKCKIEIWINKGDGSFSFYTENKNSKEGSELFDIPSMWIEDEYQVDKFKEIFEYLGYEVLVKYTENED